MKTNKNKNVNYDLWPSILFDKEEKIDIAIVLAKRAMKYGQSFRHLTAGMCAIHENSDRNNV